MKLVNGATYRLVNRADAARSLNVFGSSGSTPPSLTNVCLYGTDVNDLCQQWIYKESGTKKYFVSKANPSLALDMFTGSTAGQRNINAHVYAPSDTSYISYKETSLGYIRIWLSDYVDKYLTGNRGDGSNSGRTDDDQGNVYWAKGKENDYRQEWKPMLVSGGGTPDPGKDITVTGMPLGNTEKFHPGSGMVNGTWSQNNGSYIERKLKNFYKTVFKNEPASYNPYLYNLYGARLTGRNDYHIGIDIYRNEGDSVYTAHSGTVIKADTVGTSSGEVAIYDGKRTYYYLHMTNIAVKVGDTVTAGITKLGSEGQVGWATGPHLHLEVFDGKRTDGPKPTPKIYEDIPAICPYDYI